MNIIVIIFKNKSVCNRQPAFTLKETEAREVNYLHTMPSADNHPRVYNVVVLYEGLLLQLTTKTKC